MDSDNPSLRLLPPFSIGPPNHLARSIRSLESAIASLERHARSTASSSAPSPSSTPNTPVKIPWQATLSAILSPSPNRKLYFRSSDSSPRNSPVQTSTYISPISIAHAVRRGQAHVLQNIDPDKTTEFKEPVVFLAQAIHAGLALPNSSSELGQAAITVAQQFAALLGHHAPARLSCSDTLDQLEVLRHCWSGKARSSNAHSPNNVFFEAASSSSSVPDTTKLTAAYAAFTVHLRQYHLQARAERRQKRQERRTARIEKVSSLYNISPANTCNNQEVALLSSYELSKAALLFAIRHNIYTTVEAQEYSPRLLLTLPRIVIAFGIHNSHFPLSLPSTTSDYILTTPLQIFLPRLCRETPIPTILDIRNLSSDNFLALCRRLGCCETPSDAINLAEAGIHTIHNIFIVICTQVDGREAKSPEPASPHQSPAKKSNRHSKLQKQILKSFPDSPSFGSLAEEVDENNMSAALPLAEELSEYALQEVVEEDAVIARAFLFAAGLD